MPATANLDQAHRGALRLAILRSLHAGPSQRISVDAPLTPSGGYASTSVATASASSGTPAIFRVGAAVSDFSPPPFGQAPKGMDPTTSCDPTGQFSGPRKFAFVEPYLDEFSDGHYRGPWDLTNLLGVPPGTPSDPRQVPGDPFLDCDHNGRWEGNLLGGGDGTPRFFTRVVDPVTARAMVVSNGHRTIAVEVLDQEGFFNNYADLIRRRVARDGYHLDHMFISSTHDESAPDSLGLGGVNATTSGTNDYWLHYMVVRSAQAIEHAYDSMGSATIRYTEALEPSNVRQCWSSYPMVDDQHVPILQAVGTDGHVIATLADVSQHAETGGFNGGSAIDPGNGATLQAEKDWVTADWPHFFTSSLEQRYGGVAIEMAGSVGSVESPEVYSGPISRAPQHDIGAEHPAGCETLFSTPVGDDVAGTGHVPLGYASETQAFGDQLAQSVESAIDAGTYPSTSNTVWGEEAPVCVPVENTLLGVAAGAGVFAHRPAYDNTCTVRVPALPNGSTGGTATKTTVGAFQIGDGEFLAIPGEVFPFTYLRSFMGPEDMPSTSPPPLPPWLMPHMDAPFRFIDGLAEDMIGYIFPAGNAVNIPSQNNPQAFTGDSNDRFGCRHSDDSESASSQAADLLGNALVPMLDSHSGGAETIHTGRYVLPDGTLSRDPLGPTQSIKCDGATTTVDGQTVKDDVFVADGPAVGVELADGTLVTPSAWMSLSGLPQSVPDRDTRGYFDASGHRVWLDVYPAVNPA